MVLVQFFEEEFIKDLERKVNRFLKLKEIINVVDIKYNHYFNHEMNKTWYTAMVIYSGTAEFDSESVPEGSKLSK